MKRITKCPVCNEERIAMLKRKNKYDKALERRLDEEAHRRDKK